MLRPVISIIILIDLMWVNSPIWQDAFSIPPLKTERQTHFSQISRLKDYDANGFVTQESNRIYSAWSGLYPAFLSNLGTIDGYESANVPRNAIPKGSESYKGEAFFVGTSGELSIDVWSPNRVVVGIHADGEGYLVLNQNYYSGWKVKGSRSHKVQQLNSLLAVRIVPEDKIIEFYYSPLSFQVGWIVTCLTILVGILIWVRR